MWGDEVEESFFKILSLVIRRINWFREGIRIGRWVILMCFVRFIWDRFIFDF